MIKQETAASSSEYNSQELELLRRPVPRFTSYPPVPAWNKQVTPATAAASLAFLSQTGESSALYVHIPFCQKLCWYCGCNTQVKKQSNAADPYVSALIREMELIAKNGQIKIDEIHFGGGTPNFLSPQQFHKIFCAIEMNFAVEVDVKVSIEADPRTLTERHLETYRLNNVKRLSFGVQDFDPKVQKAINRIQPFSMVENLTDSAREKGFESINFDLIVGLPHQTVESFDKTIELSLLLRPDRIALFNFAYLPEQRPHMKLIKEKDLPSNDNKMACTLEARKKFIKAGYVEIGLDHYALPDDELAIAAKKKKLYRNFMGFTVNQSPHMIGIGSSSISETNDYFWQNERDMNHYLKSILEGHLPVVSGHAKDMDDQRRAWIIQELMCNLEFHDADFEERFGASPQELYPGAYRALLDLPHYLCDTKGGILRIHPEYKLFSRLVAACFDSRSSINNPMSTSL